MSFSLHIQSPPFVILNNGRFEGFAIDLINEIAKMGKFRYTLYASPDGKYGNPEKAHSPSGIVEEIFMRVRNELQNNCVDNDHGPFANSVLTLPWPT